LVGSIFHMTRKIVSEMTYNVLMGTLNPTIPYLPKETLHQKVVNVSTSPEICHRTTLWNAELVFIDCLRLLLRNILFKQLRCELKISKSMDFYCFLNFFTPKLYYFPHKKWTQLHAMEVCPTAPVNAEGDLTDLLPSLLACTFSSDTSVTS